MNAGTIKISDKIVPNLYHALNRLIEEILDTQRDLAEKVNLIWKRPISIPNFSYTRSLNLGFHDLKTNKAI